VDDQLGAVREEPPGAVPFDCHAIPLSDGKVAVCVHGEVDSATAPQLDALLAEQLALAPRPCGVEVMLEHTTFFGARGITVLLTAAQDARRRQVKFQITGCSPSLLRVFRIAGAPGLLAASG